MPVLVENVETRQSRPGRVHEVAAIVMLVHTSVTLLRAVADRPADAQPGIDRSVSRRWWQRRRGRHEKLTIVRWPIAGLLLAAAITGCGGSGLTTAELREFQTLEAEIIDTCARAEPGEVPPGALTRRLDRMLALMRKDPDRWYDSDPTNSPGTDDESTPELALVYIGGLLGGSEGPPPCSRAEAKRVDAAT